MLKALAALVPFFPGPFYRQATLRIHAAQLASSFDGDGEIAWSAAILLKGIKGSQEVILPRTGHIFRFSHPGAYSREFSKFLEQAAR